MGPKRGYGISGKGYGISGKGYGISGKGYGISGKGYGISGKGYGISGKGVLADVGIPLRIRLPFWNTFFLGATAGPDQSKSPVWRD